MSKELEYVPKSEVKEYKREFTEVLDELLENQRNKKNPLFAIKIVGSAKRNLVLRQGDSTYDVDYQLIFNKKNLDAAHRIELANSLREILGDNWVVSNSTSTIAVRKYNDKNHGGPIQKQFDVAMINSYNDPSEISKYNKKDGTDVYVWNELTDVSDMKTRERKIKGHDMWTFLRNDYKKIKTNELEKKIEDRKSSSELYLESINNTLNHFGK